MTITERDFRYDAFISYRSDSRHTVRRLKRQLHAIAKRHPGHDGLTVHVDTTDLGPGSLGTEIKNNLEQSRFLIVVLSRTTAQSPWVALEISHWLDTVGAPERLFLVRADPDLDLTWEDTRFTRAESLPAPLRDLFREEQKWIDYSDSRNSSAREGILSLCASLLRVEPDGFLFEETRFQRRRQRIIAVIAAALAVLMVAAVISAITAVNNQHEAERNAQEALAQADAAEALLSAADAPTLAIEKALSASGGSESSTVRSALLAVSQAAQRVKRAFVYPEAETGHPVDQARFSQDGGKLMAWGAGRVVGTSELRVWEVATGAVSAAMTVETSNLREVTDNGPRHLVACSDAGPVVIDLNGRMTSLLDETANRGCSVHSFSNGAIIFSSLSDGHGTAYSVGYSGQIETLPNVGSVAANPLARSALVAGSEGFAIVTGEKVVRASDIKDVRAMSADVSDGFFIRSGATSWGAVTLHDGAPNVRMTVLEASVADVAPELKFGRMTGELAWISNEGVLGWTRDDRRTPLFNSEGEASWTPYNTTLESLHYENFVAVYGNTAAVVRTPANTSPVDTSIDNLSARSEGGWNVAVVKERIGGPAEGIDRDPIVARCADHGAMLVRSDIADSSLLIDGRASARRIDGDGSFTQDCGLVVTGRSLSMMSHSNYGEAIQLRATLVADAVAVSPVGDQVALLKSGFPIEVLSTLPATDLPRPWDTTTTAMPGGVVTALGERELFVSRGTLVLAGQAGATDRISLPTEFADIVVAKPDGTGAVLKPTGKEHVLLAEGDTALPLEHCADAPVTYRPGAEYDHLLDAAEAQIPVRQLGDGALVDCRSGQNITVDSDWDVVAYDIGQATGRIVARFGDRTRVTTWTRGAPSSLRTVEGPPLPEAGGAVSFDPQAQIAVTFDSAGRDLTLYRRAGDGWTGALSLLTSLPDVADAHVVDGGTFVLAMSAGGGFEMFDAQTGRLVASDPALDASNRPDRVDNFTVRRTEDVLTVGLRAATSAHSFTTIRIPVGVPALTRQLCGIYPAPACPK